MNNSLTLLLTKQAIFFLFRKKGGGKSVSRAPVVLYFFPVSDLRKLALSTTLHPKCLSLGQKITMCTNCQFIEIENFRDEGKILMRGTHMTQLVLKKFLNFTKF